jgi:hypothetical protein
MSQQIISEQTRILERFYEQFDPHRVDTPDIKGTRDKFNDLAEKLRPCSGLRDPLDILPPELVLQCFMALPRERSDSLSTLLTISKKWRYFVESASILWSRIFIEDLERGLHHVQRALRLSGTSPLVVFLVLQPRLGLSHLFKGHTHRIREITLRHRAYDMEFLSREKLLDTAFSSLKDLGPLSSLEALVYTSTSQSLPVVEEDRLPIMPSIRHLVGFSVRSDGILKQRENLLQISSELDLPRLQALGRGCPKLEHLGLTSNLLATTFDDGLSQFPLLRHLVLYRVVGLEKITPLLYSRGDHLVTLQLSLRWYQLLEASYLGRLPLLTTLKLHCMFHASWTHEGPLTLPPLHHIRELHFIEFDTTLEGAGVPTSTGWLKNLFSALVTSVDNVRILKFSFLSVVPLESLLDYLARLNELERFEFAHSKLEIGKTVKRTTLPSVKSLRLPNEVFLLHIELPQISHLWIDSMASEQPSPTLAIEPSGASLCSGASLTSKFGLQLPSVKELTWNGSATIGILRRSSNFTTAFASIRRLTFAEPYARKDANDFCEVLLRHPSKCPQLETIAFHCYPSWDLLFYMLLRRNLTLRMAASPIRNIELPGYPCPSLLKPMTSLLSGRLTFIPPLSDIAINTRSGMFDPAQCVEF